MPINYQQKKYTDTVFGGTSGIIVPTGTTAQEVSTTVGTLRYNTDKGLAEFYTATGWAAVDAPPTVTNISGVINQDNSSTITVTGTGFKPGATVIIQGAAVSNVDRLLTTTYVNQVTITAVTAANSVNFVGGAAFDLKVLNSSGLSATLSSAGFVDRDPVWNTAAGTFDTIYDVMRTGYSKALSATDADGNTITFTIVSGSLPSGLSLSSSGVISGTAGAVGSDTTSSFTVRATSQASGGPSVYQDRSFNIIVKSPIRTTFSSVGTTSFTAPATMNIEVLVVGGGGGTGFDVGGGGGAGGLVYSSSYPVTLNSSYTITVGGGGGSAQVGGGTAGNGGDSVFGVITAYGGGGGGTYPSGQTDGRSGGSGGGAGNQNASGGSATQISYPSVNATGYGFGGGTSTPPWGSGGGGGAGGSGANGIQTTMVAGGAPRSYSITGSSVAYAGGGYGNADSGPMYPTGNNTSNTTIGFYGFGANGTGTPNNSPYNGNQGVVIIHY